MLLIIACGQELGTQEVQKPLYQAFQSSQVLDPKSQGVVNLMQTLCSCVPALS